MDTLLPIRSDDDAASAPPMTSVGKRKGFTVVRVVLGILLLAAAGLKFADGDFGASGGFGPFTSSFWRLAATEAEAIVGVWLLLGLAPRLLWLVALLFFLGLASASLYWGIEGQPSCGCFGTRLPVKPWYSFALDLASVAALVWWRPSRSHRSDMPYSATLRRVLSVIVGSAVILAGVFGGLTWMYGSPYEALLHVRGESISAEPRVSQVGEAVAGEQRTFTVQLSNHRDQPVEIFGGTATCSCIATDDLPIIVPPNESRSIAVRMQFRGSPGRFQHSFVLYTDDENQQTVTARFAGRVIESPSP